MAGLILLAAGAVLLAACAGISQDDVPATLAAGRPMLATEAAVINATAAVEMAAMQSTVVANETSLAQYSSVNNALGATLVASSPPTPTLAIGQVVPPPEDMMDGMDMGMMDDLNSVPNAAGDGSSASGVFQATVSDGRFQSTGVTTSVSDSGCPQGASSSFTSGTSRVYFTFRVFDLAESTTLAVAWQSGGEIRAQDEWITPRSFDDACLWFLLDSQFVAITPGAWTVALFADGQQVLTPVTFTVE